jgi:putative SOS response-associated peptidase YedK
MCFSVEVEKEIQKTLMRFNAQLSMAEMQKFFSLQNSGADPEWSKKTLNLPRKPTGNIFKLPDADGRIYPGTFTHVMVHIKGERILLPMRCRVRPTNSEYEIPSKFNVFNACMDSLETRQTWRPLYMNQHGLLPFIRFFEWIEVDGKKRPISFKSVRHECMWAPCLWSYWYNSKEDVGFYSFAIITDDPPSEILEKGHDCCPIFLKEHLIDIWPNPRGKESSEMYSILKNKQDVFYLHEYPG